MNKKERQIKAQENWLNYYQELEHLISIQQNVITKYWKKEVEIVPRNSTKK